MRALAISEDRDRKALVFILSSALVVLLHFMPMENAFPVFVVLAGTMLGVLVIIGECREDFDRIFFLFAAGFFLRLLTAVFLHFLMFVIHEKNPLGRYYFGGFFVGDGYAYHYNARIIANLWDYGIHVDKAHYVRDFFSATGTIGNYDFFNAFVYKFIGHSPLTMFFINCLVGSLVIVFVYLIARRVYNEKVAWFSSMVCVFLPSLVLWSTQNLKGPILDLAMVVSLYFIIKLRYRFTIKDAMVLFVSVVALFYLSQFTLLAISIVAAAYVFFFTNTSGISRFFRILITVTCAYLFFTHIFPRFFGSDFIKWVDVNRIQNSYGRLAYFSTYRIDSFMKLLFYMPLGIFAVLFMPFPWQVTSISQLFIVPEIVAGYVFLPLGIKGIFLSIKNKIKPSYIILIMLLFFSMFLGIYEGNIGTLYRHKSIVIILFYILVAAGLYLKKPVLLNKKGYS